MLLKPHPDTAHPGHRSAALRRSLLGLCCVFLCLGGASGLRAETATGALVVELTGMASDDGSIVYAMWTGPEDWLEDNALHAGFVPIEAGQARIEFTELPYGEYAISVYHDRNGNEKLDTGLFRIPREPIGTSNDAPARFGPPKYEDAVFRLESESLTITIPVKKLF